MRGEAGTLDQQSANTYSAMKPDLHASTVNIQVEYALMLLLTNALTEVHWWGRRG